MSTTSTVKTTNSSGIRARAWPKAHVCASPSACELTTAEVSRLGSCPPPNAAGIRVRSGHRVDHDGTRSTAPGVEHRGGFADPAEHAHAGKVTFCNPLGDREADAVVAAKVVANPDDDGVGVSMPLNFQREKMRRA